MASDSISHNLCLQNICRVFTLSKHFILLPKIFLLLQSYSESLFFGGMKPPIFRQLVTLCSIETLSKFALDVVQESREGRADLGGCAVM